MKRLVVIILFVATTAFVVNGAIAKNPDFEGKQHKYQAVVTTVDTARISQAVRLRPPPIHLPNIQALVRQLQSADRATAATQLTLSQNVIAFWNNKGRWLRAPRVAKCWEVPWQRSCTIARASYRLHNQLAAIAEYRLVHELPNINDWQTAVRFVQKIYPGTESWMLYISDREGGWGPWVWWGGSCSSPPCLWHGYHIGSDSTGDTVGGWMQFRYSTFAPYWRAAEKDLRARGFIIPDFPMPAEGGDPKYAAWLSPMGQALTAGYMRATGRDRCHWCL